MLEPHLHTLAALIAAHPDRTLAELKDALATPASVPTVWRAVRALGLTVKKTVRPSEHDRPDVAAARVAWHAAAPTWDVAHLVCLDETGITTNLLRRYGRAPRGARVHDHAPCGRWQTSTFLAALRVTGLTAPGVFDGAIDGESVRAYIEQILVPTRQPPGRFRLTETPRAQHSEDPRPRSVDGPRRCRHRQLQRSSLESHMARPLRAVPWPSCPHSSTPPRGYRNC